MTDDITTVQETTGQFDPHIDLTTVVDTRTEMTGRVTPNFEYDTQINQDADLPGSVDTEIALTATLET